MSKVVEHRSATPLIKWIKTVCRGTTFVEALRFTDEVAKRTQPPPHVPGGPYHKTSKVYYFTRDARRLVQPPVVLYSEKQLRSGVSDTVPKALSQPYKRK